MRIRRRELPAPGLGVFLLAVLPCAAEAQLVINVTATRSGAGGPFWEGRNCDTVPGFTLSRDGFLTRTSTAARTYQFTVIVQDAATESANALVSPTVTGPSLAVVPVQRIGWLVDILSEGRELI